MFEVSPEGLSKQITNRAKLVTELIQNAWDENSSVVKVSLQKIPERRAMYRLSITDDNPSGFVNLAHAYTLFAESDKKKDPTKRGRYNLGEKLFIAACQKVVLTTTKGQILFENGKRAHTSTKTEKGSVIDAEIKLSAEEVKEANDLIASLISPPNIETYFNGDLLAPKKPVLVFEAQLDTVIQDEEGYLKPTKRKTQVELYDKKENDDALIYEMGIPVVECECRWHINICQKVPLNRDRDNIAEAFKRRLLSEVLNHANKLLTEADSAQSWVKIGTSSSFIQKEAMKAVLDLRFGANRVSFSPKDQEANHRAVAEGATVVFGSHLSKEEWKHVKDMNLLDSAESRFGTEKPYKTGKNDDDLLPYQ